MFSGLREEEEDLRRRHGGGFSSPFRQQPLGIWQAQYRAYPAPQIPNKSQDMINTINYGGKVILPQSALMSLMTRTGSGPILFIIDNMETALTTYTSVLEFIAEEGRIYLPQWMMKALEAREGAIVNLATCELIKGTFVKLQPQSLDFLEITDPKAVLEKALRNFSCLHEGDTISISYIGQVFDVLVLEAKPSTAISIFETDLEVDFAPPPGYVEPRRILAEKSLAHSLTPSDVGMESPSKTTPFGGSGQRLNGRSVESVQVIPDVAAKKKIAIIPVKLPNNKVYFGHAHLQAILKEDSH